MEICPSLDTTTSLLYYQNKDVARVPVRSRMCVCNATQKRPFKMKKKGETKTSNFIIVKTTGIKQIKANKPVRKGITVRDDTRWWYRRWKKRWMQLNFGVQKRVHLSRSSYVLKEPAKIPLLLRDWPHCLKHSAGKRISGDLVLTTVVVVALTATLSAQ